MLGTPRFLALGLVLGLLFAAGCGDDAETGRLRIALGDAPFPFDLLDSTQVVIDRVEVHLVARDADASGWHVLSTEEYEVDLLELTNGVTAPLVDTEIPVGTINQIRLRVREASVTLTDGRTFVLDIPSGDRSGIKIFPQPDIEVVGALTTELLLDFDVSRSFHPIPNGATQAVEIREFFFRPSIHCANVSETGSLSGFVWSNAGTPGNADDDTPIENAAVVARRNGEEVTTTVTAADGHYVLRGLLPGEYTLEASASGFVAASREARAVVANDIDGNDFRLAPGPGKAPHDLTE